MGVLRATTGPDRGSVSERGCIQMMRDYEPVMSFDEDVAQDYRDLWRGDEKRYGFNVAKALQSVGVPDVFATAA